MFQKGIATVPAPIKTGRRPVSPLTPKMRQVVRQARDSLTSHPGTVLTLKERRFCDKYLETASAQASAIFAGYAQGTAEQASSIILRRPKVQAYISARLQLLNNPELINITDLQREFSVVGTASISDIATWGENGQGFSLKGSDAMTRDQAKLINSLEYEKKTARDGTVTETTKFKIVDRAVYLDKLARTKNAYVENISVTHEGTITHLLGRISEIGQNTRMAELDPD